MYLKYDYSTIIKFMKKNKIYFKLSIALLALSFQLNAQTWQNISYSPTGLSSNKVNSVCSDAAGNYWIATEDSGLVRVNGSKYWRWTENDRINYGFSTSYNGGYYEITRAVRNDNGHLFFRANYDLKKSGILKFDTTFHFIKSPIALNLEPVCTDKYGNIWCRAKSLSTPLGVVKYNSLNFTWQHYSISNSSIASDFISDIVADTFGNVWFAHGSNHYLSKFNGITWRSYQYPKTYPVSASLLRSDEIGNIYISSTTEFYKYKKSSDTILEVSEPAGFYGGLIGVDKSNNVLSLKDMQTSTPSTTIYRLSSAENWTVGTIQNIGLDPRSINAFNQNEFWITEPRGVYRIKGLNYEVFTKENAGLFENYSNDILKGNKPNEIIVCHSNALSFLDTITRKTKGYNQYNSGLYDNNLDDIFVDSRGNKWINSISQVQKLGPDNKTWEYYDNDSLLYIYKKLKNREDKYGNIWFFDGNGVSKISQTGSITNTSVQDIVGPDGGSIQYLTIHPNGDIWTVINTQSSYVIKKLNGNIWVSITYPFPIGSTNIVADKNSNIWFSNRLYYIGIKYYYGLVKFNSNTSTWDTISPPSDKLFSDKLFSDRFGKIWVTYPDSGAACYDGQQWTRYHKGNSNILSNNINDIYVDTLGKVWFSTNLGISVLTPAPAIAPNVSTAAATNITTNAAQVSGTIVSNGGSSITAKGICWSITPNPTVNNNKSTETTTNLTYISSLTGLSAGTKYYARAYATNAIGTSYGNEINFTTNSLIPGCVNTVLWPNASVTVPQSAGQTIEITPGNGELDCNYAGEYSRTEGWKDGLKYTIYSTRATDFITITDDNNFVIKSGVQPLEFTNSGTGIKRIHVSLNSSCLTEDVCRDISIKLNSSTGLSYYSLINNLQLFPNPNNGKMFLNGDINKNDLIEINAINMLGDCIKIKYNLVDNGLLELNIPENITGIITLEISINGKSTFEKVSIIK
jgi:ligand-binding sensor domain-containing protein